MTAILNYHTDPSHGWIEAPAELLGQYGVSPSAYSYTSADRKTVYLEEDCDAPALLRAMRAAGADPEVVFLQPAGGPSFIRRLPSYSQRT